MNLLTTSREIAALAQTGLAYSRDPYDRERFARLHEIASELLREATHSPTAEWPLEQGYATPKVDIRAVVFQENRVLLVKERLSGEWSVPGGWADVNISPAQNAEKECREESGYEVKAKAITSVKDRDLAGYPPNPFAIYKIYILCELIGGAALTGIETLDVRFFPIDALPPLDLARCSEEEIRYAFHCQQQSAPIKAQFN